MTRPIRSILFDVDGTLIDSNAAHAETWARALVEHGVPVTVEQIRPLIGMGGDKLLPAVAGVEDTSETGTAIAKRKKELFGEMLFDLKPTNGARRLVEQLKEDGIDLVIATSAEDKEMQALLERAGVADLFPKRVSKDDAAESKPAPDIIHAALRRSQAEPEATLMIGDTPYDIDGARGAGVDTIAVRCGGHWADVDLHGAVAIVDDPTALLEWWKRRSLYASAP